MPADVVAVTIATPSHAGQALASLSRWREFAPRTLAALYLVGAGEQKILLPEGVTSVPVESLPVPRFSQLAFALPPVGLCCALKPHIVLDALSRFGPKAVIYFDADMNWYSHPADLLKCVTQATVLLTPHILGPVRPSIWPSEAVIKPYGIWNAGLLGFSAGAASRNFLSWWAAQLCDPRRISAPLGWDQSWLDFVPAFVPDHQVLRHPGYNVGPWNSDERRLQRSPAGWFAGSVPLISYHFSSYDRAHPSRLVRPGLQCPTETGPELRDLAAAYGDLLGAWDARVPRKGQYTYAHTKAGQFIAIAAREALARQWDLISPAEDPFSETFRPLPTTGWSPLRLLRAAALRLLGRT